MKGSTDFNIFTPQKKTAVDVFIGWVDSAIETQFRLAGYKIPLAELSDEAWPTSQTTYLQMLSSLGTAAMAGGFSMKPAPALAPSQGGGSGNVLQDLYVAELAKIYRPTPNGKGLAASGFRAQYYAGSLAEQTILEPKGPTTDFMEGRFDPMQHLDNWLVADKVLAIQNSMADLAVDWDYMYSLFDISKGFGSSVYET